MNLSNLKIGIRLAIAFATVLSLSVIIGVFSISRISPFNGATKDVATNWLVATRSLSAYHAAISDIRRAEALHAMANKEEQFVQAENRITDDKEKAEPVRHPHVKTADQPKLVAAAQSTPAGGDNSWETF
jgi:methyl-accepting chemotaxis protein